MHAHVFVEKVLRLYGLVRGEAVWGDMCLLVEVGYVRRRRVRMWLLITWNSTMSLELKPLWWLRPVYAGHFHLHYLRIVRAWANEWICIFFKKLDVISLAVCDAVVFCVIVSIQWYHRLIFWGRCRLRRDWRYDFLAIDVFPYRCVFADYLFNFYVTSRIIEFRRFRICSERQPCDLRFQVELWFAKSCRYLRVNPLIECPWILVAYFRFPSRWVVIGRISAGSGFALYFFWDVRPLHKSFVGCVGLGLTDQSSVINYVIEVLILFRFHELFAKRRLMLHCIVKTWTWRN